MENLAIVVAALFGSGGAASLAVRLMLNGSKDSIRRIESKLDTELPRLESGIQACNERLHAVAMEQERVRGELSSRVSRLEGHDDGRWNR